MSTDDKKPYIPQVPGTEHTETMTFAGLPEGFEEKIEAAFWDFDTRRKPPSPQSDRDSFKWAVRALMLTQVVDASEGDPKCPNSLCDSVMTRRLSRTVAACACCGYTAFIARGSGR